MGADIAKRLMIFICLNNIIFFIMCWHEKWFSIFFSQWGFNFFFQLTECLKWSPLLRTISTFLFFFGGVAVPISALSRGALAFLPFFFLFFLDQLWRYWRGFVTLPLVSWFGGFMHWQLSRGVLLLWPWHLSGK